MGACQCGYTTDEEKNCNGTHKVVQAVKKDMAEKLEANGFPHAAEYVRNNYPCPLLCIQRVGVDTASG